MDKQTFGITKFLRAGNKVLSLFSGLLSAALITYSGYVLYDSFYAQNNAFSSSNLARFRPVIIDDEEVPLSQGTLASINEDYRAWLTVNDTNIDYPVMQGPDDVYYSSRDVYKNNSLTGSIYLSTANTADFSDTYNLIYGHHMDNQAMFGGLDNYLNRNYFDSHRDGILMASDKVYDLYVFAVVETDAYTSEIYSTGPDKDIGVLMSYVRNHSVFYDADVANSATKYLAMSTCSDNRTSGRLVVFARMTETNVQVIADDTAPQATPKPVIIEDDTAPQGLMHFFTPKGLEGRKCWALVNLLCLLLMAYIILPILHIKAKYNRKSLMESVNEFKENLFKKKTLDFEEAEEAQRIHLKAKEYTDEEPDEDDISAAVEDLNYRPENFSRKFVAGVVAEAVLLVIAIVVFILTEDMRQPMVLIDRWTLLMVAFVIIQLALDIWLVRYREEREEEE